jgi:nickel superoxide dismutase
MKKMLLGVVVAVVCINVFAHCQIPCGIYDDGLRFKLMAEDIKTIEKSINMIIKLRSASPVNYNQLVRWINNKEKHAGNIQQMTSAYFLAQRIKPEKDGSNHKKLYLKKLELLHRMIFYAMKCKQNVSLQYCDELRKNLKDFQKLYYGK